MKTKAVRLYGEKDLRLEEFELPAITDGEILIKIVSDSVCMSTYKTAMQGAKHLRVPDNVAEKLSTLLGYRLHRTADRYRIEDGDRFGGQEVGKRIFRW